MWPTSAGAIVGIVMLLATSSTAAALISALFQRKKITANADKAGVEAASVLSKTAISMISPLRDQIDELATRLDGANHRIGDLEFQVETLTNRLQVANSKLATYERGSQ